MTSTSVCLGSLALLAFCMQVNKNMHPRQLTTIRIGHNRVLHVHATDNGAYIAGFLQLAFGTHGRRRGGLHTFRLGNALRQATDNQLRAAWSEPGANIPARHMRSTVVQRTLRSRINDGNAAIHSSVALITTNSPFTTYPPSSSPGVHFGSPQFPQNLSSHPDRRLSRSTANCRIRKARYLTWGNIALTHEDQPSSDEPELRHGL